MWVATAISWPHEPSEREQSERTSAMHTWTNKTALVLFSQLVFRDMLEKESLIFIAHILMSQLLGHRKGQRQFY